MNILELIPGIGSIIDKVIPDPNKKTELKLELAKLDAAEATERLGVLKNMMGHKSLFVAGGIPALIWLVVLYILFNHIVFPLLGGFRLHVEPIALPEGYWTLLQTVIVGLFGKKVIDGNEWRWNGKLVSPAKDAAKIAAVKGKPSVDYNDPEAVDKRLREIAREKGIE